ncbi:hypothetical protein V9T40_002923 [Parthenolecanium corni]|uniref:Major facilitator superfamily (MFS) profile domain-containing protein n=1 Tax=Parthenolecanium corni TaxID=536013 RepID=A0AAN9TJS2_9HEMI
MKYSVAHLENGLKKSIKKDNDADDGLEGYPGYGIRHLQSLLLALAVFSGYLQRVNLAVTIVAITNIKLNDTTAEDENVANVPIYSWNSEVRGYILSAFFVGYLITNFPAAVIGVHLSNKRLLFFTFFVNGILNVLTPFLIEFEYSGSNQLLKNLVDAAGVGNWRALIIFRAIQGILQAFMFPTLHSISARWAPPHERSQLVGFIMSGIPFGTMFTLAGSGVIASTYGWPSVFYSSGAVGILWAIIWLVLGSDNPAHCSFISTNERDYIHKYIPENSVEGKKKVPWASLLTSWPVWAIVISHTGHNWGFWLLLSEMPTFIHEVLGFNIKSDGFTSALPYLVMWLLQFPVMYIADELVKRRILSISFSRKLWNTIGMWGTSISLVVLGYLDHDKKMAILFYITSVAVGCCVNVGFNINHMDLTPNYAGILMGMSNGFAATGGLGGPLIVAYLVKDMKSVLQWRMVFFVGAAITFFSNLFFLIFGSGKTRSWNDKKLELSTQ